MADKMIFPIGFDLDSAVTKAGEEWKNTYADKLEKAIQKRELAVKLKISKTGLTSLENVKRRLAELKIEPITPETKAAIKELAAELRELARALEAVKKYSAKAASGASATQAVRNTKVEIAEQKLAIEREKVRERAAKVEIAEQKLAIEREKVRERAAKAALAEERIAQARDKAANAATRSASATHAANNAYKAQETYLSRLIKRLAVYASFAAVGTFLKSVREVTAEFELQRISLGAIIQDQNRANQLFAEIKSFALSSPIKILDLTKYTKQLAAYKIGVDELFDTTKRLADVSVGLGVSMDRLILAYGQIRATGYLRASEVRQLTEAGIPIVDELAKKLTAANGELVRAGDVMDMISKREIPFEMVAQVFQDMTDKGGIFYNMQEQQGNTLYGMWQKLGDAASVMYDQIGSTEFVNEGMRMLIGGLADLMRHWRFWGKLLAWGSGLYLASIAVMKLHRAAIFAHTAAGMKQIAVLKLNVAAQTKVVAATKTSGWWTQWSAKLSLMHARAQLQAATATNVFSKALYSLKAAFLSNPLGWVILGVTALIALFGEADDSANQLSERLSEINEKYTLASLRDAENFKKLAEQAVGNPDGSKKQKEALDELNRTYAKALGVENLRIEALRSMNHEYSQAIQLIEEYNTKMKFDEREAAIKETAGATKKDAYKKLTDEMATIGFGDHELGRIEADKIALSIQSALLEGLENGVAASMEKFKEMFIEQAAQVFQSRDMAASDARGWATAIYSRMTGEVEEYIGALNNEAEAIRENNDAREAAIKQLNPYAEVLEALSNKLAEVNAQFEASSAGVDAYQKKLEEVKDAGLTALAGIDFAGASSFINESMTKGADLLDLISYLNERIDELTDPKRKAKLAEVRDAIAELAPSNEVVGSWQKQFAKAVGVFTAANPKLANSASKLSQYMMKNGETLTEYGKRLRDKVKELKVTVAEYTVTMAQMAAAGQIGQAAALKTKTEDIQALIDFLTKFSAPIPQENKGGGKKSDTRLQTLNEIEQTLTKIYQKYEELRKKEGDTKALEDIKKIYADTLAYVNKLASSKEFAKYGLKFDMPTDLSTLQDYRKAIQKIIEQLKIKGADKAALELQTKIDTADVDDAAKEIERKLKEIADKVSRTKTAKEFYEKILSQTGDVDLAADLTVSVYGSIGSDLNEQIAEQLKELVSGTSAKLPDIVFNTDKSINSKKLRKWAEENKKALGDNYKEVIKIADDADKGLTKSIENWLKATEKAKEFGEKLADVYRKTSTEIERIKTAMANGQISSKVGQDLISGYERKQAEEITKLQYEAFKDSPLYVKMFGDLDHASTKMLTNMRKRLEQMKGEWKNLDPTQLKELQSRLNEIDEQIAKRNPFKALTKSIKEYFAKRKSGKAAEGQVQVMTDAYEKAVKNLEKVMNDPSSTEADKAGAQMLVTSTKNAKEEAEKLAVEWDEVKKAIGLSATVVLQVLNWGGDLARGIADISEAMGADEEDVQYWNDVADAMEKVAGGLGDILDNILSLNVVGVVSSVLTAVPKMFVGFSQLFSAGKIRRANKEIKRQQELLDSLAYTYSRLQAATDKVFGSDYISNYNQQKKNLEAQAEAYRKQAEAERSKGKSADKDKIKEYEDQYRDTLDKISDMYGKISEQMLGSDLTSAARDFAKAWLDAYKEFANTSDKMGEKFQEMLENMVVEGALAAVMQRALEPMYDLIDNMKDEDFYSESFWKQIASLAKRGADNADAGAQTMMSFLEKAGISVRQLGGEVTGISREFASASEESINGLAAMYDTNNYYVSHIPTISENVAAIRTLISGGAPITASASSLTSAAETMDSVAMWNQHLELQQGIYRHTADTAAHCERLARYCEQLSSDVHKVVGAKGSAGSHGVRVWLN